MEEYIIMGKLTAHRVNTLDDGIKVVLSLQVTQTDLEARNFQWLYAWLVLVLRGNYSDYSVFTRSHFVCSRVLRK